MLKLKLLLGLAIVGLSLAVKVTPASAEEKQFWVENQSGASIRKLFVSENKKEWGYLDLGTVIPDGEKTKLTWNQAIHRQSCNQWVKASYSDDSESAPTQIDFCTDLDLPILFTD
jgi:hypothetical protein